MLKKTSLFVFIILVFVSCRSNENVTVHSQTNVNTYQRIETNVNKSESNIYASVNKADTETFAKTFFVISRFDDSLGEIIHHDHLIEFKDDNLKELSIYVDSQKKSSLKLEPNSPRLRADFLDTDGERYFVVVTRSRLTGPCGDESFIIVKINDDLSVKTSKPNESDCQGELYSIKIENINTDKPKEYYRQIAVGDLKFNLDKFDWIK